MHELRISDLNQLQYAADKFAETLKDNKIIAFYGEMGAGKTTFIKALCKAIGINDEVNSPTFTIVNEYRSPLYSPVYHFDFYRIESVNELMEIGFYEYIDSGELIFFEWPEKVDNILPEEYLKVTIKVCENGERIISW
ncbi:MAG: tRNA (adenosine(37)-N6)-threonylcarbamoyltransferase complex ATPase subunit type 1 TsaE [Bacteroidales bacterium]|jgi:tRNA threonylcarbamoyladenosine biosynthesis protein TsaE|nr:tRNA (adenosine(37)-N6)-threonylcarbamoyltransferase complex ATPase subunit type 1 TsaE [Bacteroidales bacterium]